MHRNLGTSNLIGANWVLPKSGYLGNLDFFPLYPVFLLEIGTAILKKYKWVRMRVELPFWRL